MKVSILIPCYNAERWIGEAIQSALNQTWADKEVIVVDDGSVDNSLDVIRSFGDQIQWESGPNRGGNVARNRLLELASGEWVQYLDADDYLLPDKIEKQLIAVAESKKNIDVVYAPARMEVWRDGCVLESTASELDANLSLEQQWISWQVAQTGTMLWKKKSLSGIGGWNEEFPCCQDNEVTLRAIQQKLTFFPISEAGAVYRIWSEETVCRQDVSKVIAYKTRLIEEMVSWLKQQGKLDKKTAQIAGQAFLKCHECWRAATWKKLPCTKKNALDEDTML